MAIIRLVPTVKESMLNQVKAALDAGSGPATIKIYTGTQPTLPTDAVTTQTCLGTLTFSDPCGTVGGTYPGEFHASAITADSSADATGTASWARIADSTGATVMDINISVTGGGGALQMNTTNVVLGGPITVTSFVLTLP